MDVTKGRIELIQAYIQLAVENQIQKIAFPSISTGVYVYTIMLGSLIAVREVRNFLLNNPLINQVSFVCFYSEDLYVYKSLLQ